MLHGQTYVVTQEKHAVEIVLDSSVIAFTCGQFTVDGLTTPALVYVHRDRVVVYYKLELKARLPDIELVRLGLRQFPNPKPDLLKPVSSLNSYSLNCLHTGGAHRDPPRDQEGPGIPTNAGQSQDQVPFVGGGGRIQRSPPLLFKFTMIDLMTIYLKLKMHSEQPPDFTRFVVRLFGGLFIDPLHVTTCVRVRSCPRRGRSRALSRRRCPCSNP